MNLSKKERLVFALIIISFIASTLVLLLVILYPIVEQAVIRRAWVPRQVIVIDEPLIGRPSSTKSELNALTVVREDVPLPSADSFFDTGFRPKPDGFSFRNYGTRFPEGNLTIEEVRRLFGDTVCATIDEDTCVPTPATHTWIDAMNDYMAAGHCAGFTILSNRFFADQVEQADFTSNAQTTFDVTQNVQTMRQISKDWVLQVTEEVWQSRVDGTPRDIIDALLAYKQPVDLGVFGRKGGGHSMLAYGVRDQGDGFYHILVYDNNWPEQELYIEVDYKANTWKYSLAATNPNEDAGAWDGDARTRSLIFLPFSAYDQPVTCPFCPAGTAETTSKFMFVTLSGDEALLQASNEQGQRLGHYDDEFVNEMADARLIRLKDSMFNDLEPYLGLPEAEDFTLRLTPRPGQKAAKANLWSGGPLMAFAIENIKILAGQEVTLGVSPLNQSLTFTVVDECEPVSPEGESTTAPEDQNASTTQDDGENPTVTESGQDTTIPGDGESSTTTTADKTPDLISGGQTPTIKLSVEHQGKSYLFTVSGITLSAGDSLIMAVDPETGQLSLGGNGLEEKTVNLTIAELDGDQANVFVNDQITLGTEEATTAFAFTDWAESDDGTLAVYTDTDGDGIPDETAPLANESASELLDDLDSAEAIIAVLDEIAPYIEGEEIEDILTTLVTLGLDGDDLGEVIFTLSEWELSTEVLVDFVSQANLPIDELAHFVNELAPDDESLTVWLDALDLSAETESVFITEMESIEEVDAVILEIEFLNLGEESPELVEEIINSDLTWDQIGYLLDELNLVIEELTLVITALNPPPDVIADILHELNLVDAEETLFVEAVEQALAQSSQAPNDETPVSAPDPAGGDTPPTATGTATPLVGPTATATPSPTASPIPTNTATPSPTAMATPTATYTPVPAQPTATSKPTSTHTPVVTSTPAATLTPTSQPNSAPVAANDSVTAPENTAVTIAVLGNDTDPDGDSLSISGVGTATNGNVSVSGSSIIYTPNTGYIGADSFTYTITDGSLTNSASVTVNVNGAPTPANDTATTSQGVAVTIDVLSNDTDPEGDTLSIQSVNPAANGTVSIVGGQILYTPNATFSGLDIFTYFVTDGVQAIGATVSVTVTNVNDAPIAVNDLTTTNEDASVTITVLGNDTDPDGDSLSIDSVGAAANGSAVIISGTVILYTPNANYAGTDVFNYTITDGTLTDSASVTVIVNALNDDPPVAMDDSATTAQNTSVNISVLANDSDPDNDPLELIAVGPAANGSASFLMGGSSVFYIPNAGFTGTDTFTYTISDGGLTDTGTITVTVTP